jgi:hypothetical protein
MINMKTTTVLTRISGRMMARVAETSTLTTMAMRRTITTTMATERKRRPRKRSKTATGDPPVR